MKKQKVVAFLIAVLTLSLVAGCGGGKKEDQKQTQDQSQEQNAGQDVNVPETTQKAEKDPESPQGQTHFEIANADDLMAFMAAVTETTELYKEAEDAPNEDELREALEPITGILIDDVDISSIEWEPVSAYLMELDGDGHSISGLTCFHEERAGLFSFTSDDTVIKNLTMKDEIGKSVV